MVKYVYLIAFIVAVALAVWAFLRFDGCSGRVEKLIVKDSVPYSVFLNTVEIRDTGTTKRIYIPLQADSLPLKILLAQMDSLRKELHTAQVKSIFSTDTTTADSDKIHVDCDEISRSIALKIEFAKRQVMIKTEREVIVKMEKPQWSIGIGAGAILTPEGQVKYGVTATLQYNIFTF